MPWFNYTTSENCPQPNTYKTDQITKLRQEIWAFKNIIIHMLLWPNSIK